MKIDTSKIEGYAEMTTEQKLAALEGFEYDDHAAELEKQKAAVSKANADAAEWKRKHNALLTDEQRKQQEQADKLESMEKELAGLRKEKTVSEYKAKLVAQGYDEALANETAAAMESGDMTTVFANNQKFLTDYAKRVVAEKLKGTPRGADGQGRRADRADFRRRRRNRRCRHGLLQENHRGPGQRRLCCRCVLHPPPGRGGSIQ